MKEKKQEATWKRILYRILFIIALLIFLYSAYQLYTIFKANYDEKKEIERISEIANIPADPNQPFSVNWDELRTVNSDVVGWILIPNTNISYPIVQTKNNEYYLNMTFEKQSNYAGAIFMDKDAQGDFSDNNTFIYGHNTRHGTMFGQLENFVEADFFNTNPYMYIFTPEQNYRGEIISFHSTKAGTDFYQYGIKDVDQWQRYLDLIRNVELVHKDVALGQSDRLVSLSTCSYEIQGELTDQRYLLHAKLVPWIGEYTEE